MNRFWTSLLLALASACSHSDRGAEGPPQNRSIQGSEPKGELVQPLLAGTREELAGEAAQAFDFLLATQRFTDNAIYDGGATPKEVICVRILLRQEDAARIFLSLVKSASMGTRLYGLCGLYFADPVSFEAEIPRFRGTEAVIEYQTGCSTLLDYPVKDLVDLGAGNAVRLDSREQSIRAWKLEDEARFSLRYDIAGGGFPDLFRTGGGYGELQELDLEQGAD